ncbi:MAG: alpha/beta fold hydrolase [Planctomycetaceae bacterium]
MRGTLPSLLFLAACASAPPAPLPLSAVVRDPSGPQPFQLAWSPDGARLTYLLSRQGDGLTDLWTYELAAREHRILLRADGEQALSAEERAARERRRERHLGLSSYQWNPVDGTILVPLSGDLFLLREARLERLTSSAEPELDPRWSPDGRSLAFVRGNDLWVRDAAGERRLTSEGGGTVRCGLAEFIASEELGRHRGFWWSKDSARIAYVRTDASKVPIFRMPDPLAEYGGSMPQEYPRAGDPNVIWKLGVVPAAGGATHWAEVADEYLARVEWREGGGVVFQTLDRSQETLTRWRWEPGAGDAEREATRRDAAWAEPDDDLSLAPDGSAVWPLPEVVVGPHASLADWDARAGLLHFAANRGNERHLFVMRAGSQEVERVTREPGWHAALFSPDHARYLHTHSRAGVPPRLVLRSVDGSGETVLFSPPPLDRLPRPEFLEIPADDGTALPAMLLRPALPGRRPAIVHVYGGPGAQLVADRWGGRGYLFHARLAQQGYAVLIVDNRGSGGRGGARERLLKGRLCDLEVRDQAAGARWLGTRPFVEPRRVGVWGWSYGGTMTLMCLLREPGLFSAGVAVAPVTDWRDYDTAYTERYLGLPSEREEAYRLSSPISFADSLQRPLLLVHGFQDDNVHFRGAVAFLDAAQRAGKLVEQDFWPRGAHGIGGSSELELLYRRIEEFFARTLGG